MAKSKFQFGHNSKKNRVMAKLNFSSTGGKPHYAPAFCHISSKPLPTRRHLHSRWHKCSAIRLLRFELALSAGL